MNPRSSYRPRRADTRAVPTLLLEMPDLPGTPTAQNKILARPSGAREWGGCVSRASSRRAACRRYSRIPAAEETTQAPSTPRQETESLERHGEQSPWRGQNESAGIPHARFENVGENEHGDVAAHAVPAGGHPLQLSSHGLPKSRIAVVRPTDEIERIAGSRALWKE
jgi:hypothetical protein